MVEPQSLFKSPAFYLDTGACSLRGVWNFSENETFYWRGCNKRTFVKTRDTQITLKKSSKWRQLISLFSVSVAESTCVIGTKLDEWGIESQVWLRGTFGMPLLTMGERARVKTAVDSHLIALRFTSSAKYLSSGSRSPSGILLGLRVVLK